VQEPQVFQHTCTPQKQHQLSIRTIKELLSDVLEKLYLPHRANFSLRHIYTKGGATHQVDFNEDNGAKKTCGRYTDTTVYGPSIVLEDIDWANKIVFR